MSDFIDIPRQKLEELIAAYGDGLWHDRELCEGLLRDRCGAFRREISALTAGLQERVPQELKSSWRAAMTPEAMRARLIQRLEDNCGLAPQIAAWAVDTWAHALNVPLAGISDRTDTRAPAPQSSPLAGAAPSSGDSAWVAAANPSLRTNRSGGPAANQNAGPGAGTQARHGAGSGPPSPGLLSKAAARSFAGIALVAVCALGFLLLHKPKTELQPPCANRAADGSCLPAAPSPSALPGSRSAAPAPESGSGDRRPNPSAPPAPLARASNPSLPPAPLEEGSNPAASPTPPARGSHPSASPARADDGRSSARTPAPPAVDRPLTDLPAPATLAAGTPLRVKLNEELTSSSAKEGQAVGGTLADPLVVDGKQIVAAGARAVLTVQTVTQAGDVGRRPELRLALSEIYVDNLPVRVSTNEHISRGPSQTVGTVKAKLLGAAGCVSGGLGKIFHHGGKKCGTSGDAETPVGAGAISDEHPAAISADSILEFRLAEPLAIHAGRAERALAAQSPSGTGAERAAAAQSPSGPHPAGVAPQSAPGASAPDWVPVYPRSTPAGPVTSSGSARERFINIFRSTNDPCNTVLRWYQQQLEAAGFHVYEIFLEDESALGCSFHSDSPDHTRSVYVSISRRVKLDSAGHSRPENQIGLQVVERNTGRAAIPK